MTRQRTAPSRRAALAVLCAGTLMIILDGSIVTVALPAIRRGLGFSAAGLTWTMNAYLIAFGGLLLLAGRLGDLLGRRRVFVAGLALFTLASLLCGLAHAPWALIAARFLQGAGGALVSAVGLGMVVTLFPEPAARGKALGVYAFTGSAGASIGQVLGGVVTDAFGWSWVFLINLPVGAVTAFAALRLLRDDRGPGLRGGADALGAVLVTGGVMLGVYTIVQTEEHGWATARTAGLAALALVLLAGFFARQATAAAPLLLAGLGSGLVITPNQTLTLAEVPVDQAGSAAGMLQTSQRIGAAAGIAGIGAIFFGALAAHRGWTPALREALLAVVGFVLVALVAAVVDSRGERPGARERAADG